MLKRASSLLLLTATNEAKIDTDDLNRPCWLNLCKASFHLCLAIFLLPSLSLIADAQEANFRVADTERESLGRATRIMRKLDTNDNGTFEQDENTAAWKRYRKLDVNGDGVLSIGELRKQRIAYLESGGEKKLNLVYKQISGRDLLLDLYYPSRQAASNPSTAPGAHHPIIVYTHGGGWAAGSKQGIANGSFKAVFQSLLDKGFAVASVNYRLCKSNSGVTMRDCVIDSKDAVRYLAKHSDTLRLDAARFFVMGDSAGGHIAQMLLLTSPESLAGDRELADVSYTMRAGVSWYGPCDFEKTHLFNHDDRPDFRDRFGPRIVGPNPDPASRLTLYREMSPINYLNANSRPLLMIQGDKDTTIPVKHAYYMQRKAAIVDAPVEIMIIKNSGHNWRKVLAEIDPSRDAIIERTVKFLADHL